jgi:hypothetical protein
VPDALGACPVDHVCLGVAIPDDAVALGTRLSAPRPWGPPNAMGPRTARRVAGATTAVWDHWGKPVVTSRWVLIRDPEGRFAPQALLAANPQLRPVQIPTASPTLADGNHV